MRILLQMIVTCCLSFLFADSVSAKSVNTSGETGSRFIIVKGAGGEEQYEKLFDEWVERWTTFAEKKSSKVDVIGNDENANVSDRDRLLKSISELRGENNDACWIVFIGHGTFDGKQAKFNLRGRDITAKELQQSLSPVEQQCVLVCCFSCSGAFVPLLADNNRIVIASTRNGFEFNFSHFGDYLSQVINDPTIDLDKDDETSILEAFLVASKKTAEFYQSDARIITEHPVIDDNGDGVGTPADSFQGVRGKTKPKNGLAREGSFANQMVIASSISDGLQLSDSQREQRRALESEIETLRAQKASLDRDAYFIRLEALLLKMAELQTQPAIKKRN